MVMSRDLDLFASGVSAMRAEEIADLLENIGQLSMFDDERGYYADGVEPHTAMLPPDWRERSKVYSSPATNGVTAIAPHPDDIAVSKLYAGRDKDIEWVAVAHAAGLIDLDRISARIQLLTDLLPEKRNAMLDSVVVARRKAR